MDGLKNKAVNVICTCYNGLKLVVAGAEFSYGCHSGMVLGVNR